MRKQASETDMNLKKHAKGLVLRLTEEASKRKRRDFEKACKGAYPKKQMKLAKETDVTSKRHAEGLVLKTEEASKQTNVTLKRPAKGLVLRQTQIASK